MAIDTAEKRGAALRFGHGPTTTVPTGVSAAFSRAAGLGCYYLTASAVLVDDLYLAAGQLYQDGTRAGRVYQDGTRAGQLYHDGTRAGAVI